MAKPLLGGAMKTESDRPEQILRPGNTNCGGCGMSITLRMLTHAAARQHPVQLVIPACCAIVAPGQYPFSAYGAPVVASTFGSAAAVASGLAQVAHMNGEKTRVIAFAGDGGTYDIGMATVSAAAERNEDILYLCYDNEIYGNTGGQRSSATPFGASTSTTPYGKDILKKDILGIMAAHRVPYAASVSLAHPEDALRKMHYALGSTGFRFLHVLSPCPTGWKAEAAEGIELVRLAVRSGLYPVYEVFGGHRMVINVEPEMSLEALEQYFAKQGRFQKSKVRAEDVRASIERSWRDLRGLAALRKEG
ncbi:MAG: pyruvate synthase subunit beta [Planctomycetes bacterium]|nr:pyruvate synthase subunit beta [Planctomycetota bacterium]